MARRKKTVRKTFKRSRRSSRRAPVRRRKTSSAPRQQTIRIELVQNPGVAEGMNMAFLKAAPTPRRRRF